MMMFRIYFGIKKSIEIEKAICFLIVVLAGSIHKYNLL